MLQVQYIKDNKEIVLNGLEKRNFKKPLETIDTVIAHDENRKATQAKLDATLAESNKLSKEIGMLFKSGEPKKAGLLKEKTAVLKEEAKLLSEQLTNAATSLQELLYTIPNIPNELVPAGTSEEDNEVVFEHGTIPELHEGAEPHWEWVKKYDIVDFELGNKISAAGFPVYKGKGARLQRALINFFLDQNTAAGYNEVQPPYLVNEASGIATGQLPDKEGQMYHDAKDDLYLIPTAEVPVKNMYRNVVQKEADFPICNTAYTPCFRREAGSYGAHVRGLNRLHQFDKVEIVRLELPEKSYEALDGMVAHVKNILEALGLPYRILKLCAGDLGFTSALTYDFEIYSTAQQKWLEVSSVSNFETFQANRLKLRYKNSEGKNQLAHTLNGSALALPRILAGLLENFQTPDGISIPEVLVPYTGFNTIK